LLQLAASVREQLLQKLPPPGKSDEDRKYDSTFSKAATEQTLGDRELMDAGGYLEGLLHRAFPGK
jgi:hypothetical protein